MLSIFLTDELEKIVKQRKNATLLFYFCSYQDEKRNSAVAILRGLLYQIITERPQLIKHVLPYFDSTERAKLSQSSLEALWIIFEKILRDSALGTIFCVLDGLDECDEVSLRPLITRLVNFFPQRDSTSVVGQFKLVVVSREIPGLDRFPRVKLDPDLDEQVASDIQLLISVKVDELSKIERFNDIRAHVQTILLERAEGTFLWVGFVMNELSQKRTCTEVLETLDALPKGLPATYSRMLLQIESSQRQTTSLLLRWVTMALRPLTLKELAAAIGIGSSALISSNRAIRDQVALCGSFLKIREHEVGLVHQSAKDYLLRENPDDNPLLEQFRIKPEEAHFELARTCFAYIQNGVLANGPLDLTDAQQLRDFPLLKYAVLCWPEHARYSSKYAEEMFDPSGPFFQKKSPLRKNWWQTYHRAAELDWARREWVSPLQMAACFGIFPWAQRLVKKTRWEIIFYKPADEKDSGGWTALMWAAARGHEAMVRLLLENRAEVEAKDSNRWTALHQAAVKGHEAVVRLLIEKGADPDSKDKDGWTPLPGAAANGHEAVMRLLLEKGVNVNAQGGWFGNALQAASLYGHDKMVELLLDKGAEVNAQGGYFGNALQAASAYGHSKIVELLLDKGAEVNAQGGEYGNALQAASEGGHDKMVELLLDKGAEMNAQGGEYGNALQAAARGGHDKIVELLLDKGAEINAQGGYYGNALQAASVYGHDKTVKLLLDKGAEANAQGGYCGNALQAATWRGDDKMVELLLDKGAEVNARDGEYDNALQAATWRGHDKIVELLLQKVLLEKGADVHAQGDYALRVASAEGHDKVVEILLEKGADVNTQGDYALRAASAGGHDKVVEILLDKGADVNAQGGYYGNALQAALAGGHDKIVELLLDKGAEVNAQGGYFGNALQAASVGGHDKTVELLLDKGAEVNAVGGYYGNALQAASRGGHDKTVELLLDKGAEVNAQGGRWSNALQAASRGGYDKTVEVLLDKGANVNAQGGRYGNALQATLVYGHDKIMSVLVSIPSRRMISGVRLSRQKRIKVNSGRD